MVKPATQSKKWEVRTNEAYDLDVIIDPGKMYKMQGKSSKDVLLSVDHIFNNCNHQRVLALSSLVPTYDLGGVEWGQPFLASTIKFPKGVPSSTWMYQNQAYGAGWANQQWGRTSPHGDIPTQA